MEKKSKGNSKSGQGPTTLDALKQLSSSRVPKLDKSAALITFLSNNNILLPNTSAIDTTSSVLQPYTINTIEVQGETTTATTVNGQRRSRSRTKRRSSSSNRKSTTTSVGVQAIGESGHEIYDHSSHHRDRSQSTGGADASTSTTISSSSSNTTKSNSNNNNDDSTSSSSTNGRRSRKQSATKSSSDSNENNNETETSTPAPIKEKPSNPKKSQTTIASSSNMSSSTPAVIVTNTANVKSKTSVTGLSKVISRRRSPLNPVSSTILRKAMPGPTSGISLNWRALVEKAVRDRKIFCIGGSYPAIRSALKRRGWVEKALNCNASQCMKTIIDAHLSRDVDLRALDDETDAAYAQRVLANYPPDFVWVIRRDNVQWNHMGRDQMINRFPKAFFTTKVGIAACIQSMHWFSELGVSDTFFPRCYRICMDEERQAFMDDYRLTACLGLLRWVCTNYEKEGEKGIYDSGSRVSSLAVDFAVRQVNNYVRMRRHEDIDWLMPPAFLLQHWDVFLSQYYAVIHQKQKLAPRDSSDSSKAKYDISKKSLQRVAPYWPQLYVDGISNLWICKPGARSRGKGIIILNHLDKIMDLLSHSNFREFNWVVQKYIERPLLIYKTKFDIRQWFIVTDWAPLTIWFAKESYVRFCCKPFTLEDCHESLHLTNNAVQCKYQNDLSRDSALPDENMWDCYTFQAYLKTIGKLDLWDKVIYPGMKQGIIGVMLASQESADVRKNCFELYGADYMLSEDFRPWLIEINSCPCMAASTSVTARMCAQCLEDTIKVVIDKKENKNADTGMFELIYRQNPATLTTQAFIGSELMVSGKRLTKDIDWPGIMTKYNAKRVSRAIPRPTISSSPPTDNGISFLDLVQKLRLKESSNPLSSTVASASHAAAAARRFLQTGTPLSIPQITFPETLSTPRIKGGAPVANVKKLASGTTREREQPRKSSKNFITTL